MTDVFSFKKGKRRRDTLTAIVDILESESEEMLNRAQKQAGQFSFDEDVTAIKEDFLNRTRVLVRGDSDLEQILHRFALSFATMKGLINGLAQQCKVLRERGDYWQRQSKP
jgi:hypothetical protein